MGTLQNPNPNPTRISHPNPNPAAIAKPPSFDDVSKLFSLPLADAADSLGVCPSVLKKVCYDNGLVRWPHRKVLAGKRIEEIKKDATIEKEKKKQTELKVAGERNDTLASSAVSSSLAPQAQSAGTGLLQESPTSRILTQQPTKDNQTDSPHNTLSSIMNKGPSSATDEFKYGFPSAGLSSVSLKWWGNKGEADTHVQEIGNEDDEEKKQQSENLVDTAAAADLSSETAKAGEGKKNETDAAAQWAGLLASSRKKAAEEGQQALKLGVYKGYNARTLDRTKRMVLVQVFKSSLPDAWGDMSSEG